MQYYHENYGRYLPEDRNAPILDLGCGDGDFVRYLVAQGYTNITAVDLDVDAMNSFRDLPGVKQIVTKIDPSTLPNIGGSYALIILKQMIYYFDRREVHDFLASVRDALAEDGTIIVEIFNGGLPSGRFTEVKDAYILTSYSEHSLRTLVTANGFDVVSLHGASIQYGALYRLMRWALIKAYKMALVLDRGFDAQIPQITGKYIIAIAKRRG